MPTKRVTVSTDIDPKGYIVVPDDFTDEDILGLIGGGEPKPKGDVFDAPAKPKEELINPVSFMLSPFAPLSRAAQGLANKVEGVDRGVVDPPQFEVAKTAPEAVGQGLDMLKNFVMTPFRGYKEVAELAPDLIRNTFREPVATARGAAAGAIEVLGNLSPLDIIGGVAGAKGAKKLSKWSRGTAAETAKGAAPENAGASGTTQPPSLPPSRALVLRKPSGEVAHETPIRPIGRGTKESAPTSAAQIIGAKDNANLPVGEPTLTGNKIVDMLYEAYKEDQTLPGVSLDDPTPIAKPKTLGRELGELGPGGKRMLGKKLPEVPEGDYVTKGGKRIPLSVIYDAEGLLKAAADEVMNEGLESGAGRKGPRKVKKQKADDEPTPREIIEETLADMKHGEERPQVPLSADPAPHQTMTDMVNAMSRKEPEVIAPRNAVLEKLAQEMESRAVAPNRDALNAIMAESLPGASGGVKGKVVTPPVERSPGVLPGSAEPVAPTAPTIVPRSDIFQVIRDIPTNTGNIEFDNLASRLKSMRGILDKRGLTDTEFKQYGDMAEAVRQHPSMPKELNADWDRIGALNEARGPKFQPGDQIKVREKSEATSKPTLVKPASDVKKLPPLRELEKAKKAVKPEVVSAAEGVGAKRVNEPDADRRIRQEIEETAIDSMLEKRRNPDPIAAAKNVTPPVKKIAPDGTKPVAKTEVDLSRLSGSEKVRFTGLEKRMPAKYKQMVHDGSKWPNIKDGKALDDLMDYDALVKKAKGQEPPPVAPLPKADVPQVVATPDPKVKTPAPSDRVKAAADKLPNVVRHLIDSRQMGAKLREIVDARPNAKQIWNDISDYAKAVDAENAAKNTVAVTKEIDAAAQSVIDTVAKEAGVATKKVESTVARSEEVAKKIALPAKEPPPVKAKDIDAAVDSILAGEPPPPTTYTSKRTGKETPKKFAVQKPGTLVKGVRSEDIGPAPRGVDERSWRAVNASAIEAGRLYKTRGILDARLIETARRMWGSEEASRRMGIPVDKVRDLGGPAKRKPMEAVLREIESEAQKRFDYLTKDDQGFMRTEALAVAGGAMVGGLYGAASVDGDDITNVAASTVANALFGMMVGSGMAKGFATPKGTRASKASRAIEEADTANLLAGPAAIKASLGSIGAVVSGFIEQLAMGNRKAAYRGLKALVHEGPGIYLNTLKNGLPKSQMQNGVLTSNVLKQSGTLSTKVLDVVLRPFNAADQVGKTALKRMGFSEEESLRMMLNGDPTSQFGHASLKLVNSLFLTRMLMKFPRVRIGAIERGIEYTPWVNKRINTRQGHGAPAIPKRQLTAKGYVGGAAMATGLAYGYYADPTLAEAGIVSAAAGPASLPFAAMTAAGKALRHGGGPVDALEKVALEVVDSTPRITDTNIRALRDRVTPGRPLKRSLGIED